jgi:ribosome-binding protein aMBF1 (putative translation factor)
VNERKRERLEQAGWTVGSAREFAGLTAQDEFLMELQLDLGAAIRELRAAQDLTQGELAEQLGTSASHVSEMEAGHGSTSRMIRALAALGVDRTGLARVVRLQRSRGSFRACEVSGDRRGSHRRR